MWSTPVRDDDQPESPPPVRPPPPELVPPPTFGVGCGGAAVWTGGAAVCTGAVVCDGVAVVLGVTELFVDDPPDEDDGDECFAFFFAAPLNAATLPAVETVFTEP